MKFSRFSQVSHLWFLFHHPYFCDNKDVYDLIFIKDYYFTMSLLSTKELSPVLPESIHSQSCILLVSTGSLTVLWRRAQHRIYILRGVIYFAQFSLASLSTATHFASQHMLARGTTFWQRTLKCTTHSCMCTVYCSCMEHRAFDKDEWQLFQSLAHL